MADGADEEAAFVFPRRITLKRVAALLGALFLAAGITNLGDLIEFVDNFGKRGDGNILEAHCCTDSVLSSQVAEMKPQIEQANERLISIQRMMLNIPEIRAAARKDRHLDSIYREQERLRIRVFEGSRGRRSDNTRTDTTINLARARHEATRVYK